MMMRRALVLALALVPACEAAPDRCEPGEVCTEVRLLPTSIVGSDLASGDLDGDGRPDLVAVGGFGVSVRWGGPEGPATRLATSAGTVGARIGDVDGDGALDLVALLNSGRAAWLLGAGSRSFAPAEEVALGAAIRAAALADVDGDRDDDLVVAEHDAPWLRVLPGGPEGLGAGRRVRIGGEAVALAAGDFTGDGIADVAAVVPARGQVELLRGAAEAPLAEGTIARRSSFPRAAAAADFDGDGALDLAIGDALDPSVWIGLGDGSGGWRSEQVWPAFDEPGRLLPRRGAAGIELAVVAADRQSFALLDPRAAALRAATLTTAASGVAALDVDGDGRDELVLGAEPSGVIREVEGFQPAPRWRGPEGGAAGVVALADLDGDGLRELVAEGLGRGEVVVYAPEGEGFALRVRAPLTARLGGMTPFALGDGREAVAFWTDYALEGRAELQGMSYGTDDVLSIRAPTLLPGPISGAVAADLEGDGRQELALLTRAPSISGVHFVGPLHVARFVEGPPAVEALADPSAVFGVAAADLDGDGRDTLWVTSAVGVSELREAEGGWTTSPLPLSQPVYGALAWVDVDDDGALELLSCGGFGVQAYEVPGAQTAWSAEKLSSGACSEIQACDVDGDGADELVLTRALDPFSVEPIDRALVEVLRRGPDGWRSAGSFAPAHGAVKFAARCEADGLALASGGRRGVALAGLVPGPALQETPRRSASRPSVQIADLDGDGLDEVVTHTDVALIVATPDGQGGYGPARSLAPPGTRTIQQIAAAAFDEVPGAELRVTFVDWTAALWALRGGALVELPAAVDLGGLPGDFDGDGRDELFQTKSGELGLARPSPRAGEPSFEPVVLAGEGAALVGASPRIVDVDGDGRADLVHGDSYPADSAQGPAPQPLWVLRSAGAASFEAPRTWSIEGDWQAVRFGDVDEDGRPEALYVDREGALVVCPGDGRGGPGGACRAWWTAPPGVYAVAPSVGDIDHDGVPDLVALLDEGDATSALILRGLGGRFIAAPPLRLSEQATLTWLERATVRPGSRAWLAIGGAGVAVFGGGP